MILRKGIETVQAVAFKSDTVSKEMIKFMGKVQLESIVEITCQPVEPKEKT